MFRISVFFLLWLFDHRLLILNIKKIPKIKGTGQNDTHNHFGEFFFSCILAFWQKIIKDML